MSPKIVHLVDVDNPMAIWVTNAPNTMRIRIEVRADAAGVLSVTATRQQIEEVNHEHE